VITELKLLPNGDGFLELPEEVLLRQGLGEGDRVELTVRPVEGFTLRPVKGRSTPQLEGKGAP
jgi:hypothetical protein